MLLGERLLRPFVLCLARHIEGCTFHNSSMFVKNRRLAVTYLAVACTALLVIVPSVWLLRGSEFARRIQPWSTTHFDWQASTPAKDSRPMALPASVPVTEHSERKWPVIPNIVHYAYLMEDVDADLKLKFEDFLSVYSSLHYFNPESIFIHTDASPQSLERTRDPENKETKWTRKIFDLPRVVVRYGTAPEYADNGKKIENLPNRSDFLRAKVVYELGGTYFDFDVFPLRDFKPFREAGFANVVGLEKYDNVNSGCYMSIQGSELMKTWLKHEHIVYDGGWITHAVELLTKIVHRVHRIPYEVLVLGEQTWAPTSWELDDARKLFESHPDSNPGKPSEADFDQERELTSSDLESLFEEDQNLEDWQWDWSGTYAIHAFKSEPEKMENFPGYSVKYILERKSNLARALYPALRHAIEEGYVTEAN